MQRPPSCFLREDDEDEDMMMANGPDDLGDLMQQMREGAAWAEGLVMEGHLSPAPTAGTAVAAPPAAGAAAGDDGGSPDLGPATLAAVSRRQQREAEQDAAMSEMQPAMRALLMHPGVAGSKQLMIPVCGAAPPPPVGSPAPARGPAPQGLSCAAALAASRPGGCPPAWSHPQLVAQHFFQQPGHFGIPRGAAPPFAYFQAPPVSFVPAPPADCSPQASLDVAAAPAWQQPHHQHSGGAYVPLPNSGGPACMTLMPLAQPNISGASGSANASDSTSLRLRSSFESDTGGSGARAGCAAASGSAAPAVPLRNRSGALAPAVVPQLPGLEAEDSACYGKPAFERQAAGACAAGWEWRPPGGAKCDSPSDSSDCDDSAGRDRYEGSTQASGVVPEVEPELATALPLLPMPLPMPAGPPLLAPLPLPGAPPHALPALLGGWGPADFPPMPTFCGFYDTPAAHAARLARHASMERYRLKKARRCAGKKIRYVKRKVN
ncbi:hypothetical protein ABPG77_006654, partial [Micractinium sp. CCAP 211/92]